MSAAINVTTENIDDFFSEVELFLNSFFDSSYAIKPARIILENETYRFTYEKQGVKYHLSIDVLSATVDNRVYRFTYEGEYPLRKPVGEPHNFKITNV
jgi:hypothetical protein